MGKAQADGEHNKKTDKIKNLLFILNDPVELSGHFIQALGDRRIRRLDLQCRFFQDLDPVL
jgi:hypothetical protein